MIDIPRFVAAALALQGVPFAHQGRTSAGLDCAGIVLAALAEQGVHVEAPANYTTGAAGAILLDVLAWSPLLVALPLAGEPQPGDLLAFRIRREPQHLGIALGGGRMVHAIRSAGVCAVTISPLWRQRLAARFGWSD